MPETIDLLELIRILILSIVQGITEWLPISSTGHMILVEEFLPLASSAAFKELFMVLVQLGSIFAVVVLYFNKLNPLSLKKSPHERHDTWIIWFKVVVASIPAVLFGFILDDYMDKYLNTPLVVAAMLILYGFAFIWVESRQQSKHTHEIKTFNKLTFRDAFMIGCFQALAIIPGTSRSGATIIGALLLGSSRFIATEFSFYMSIPIMFGASLKKLLKFGFTFTHAELIYLGIGMLVAFIVSLIAIKFLLNYIKRHDFKAFGYYRIILGSIIILYFLFTGLR
ncbi:undecaprenyl-diphosphate phosphatase [Tuanshanicoccus lijuaniae]|uniref:undecaprenyl-diphosphate phosphatase n=1 Tax=Aerococcaceae bacterium zg-1292 TaxID=2774330 RepID=UPI001BD89302|nr:undecaprenyl-diphosphate phosphatase [Aerococcaceae bacterium zg-BR22]MBS4456080.1 undecaprenyl-diphosphate phosphatase [Aerococcaceae bacterium zg-A91]MBS4457832.1 undecaprenyl-diphosphate phosphatase [Aerococcaceae bacterium zg-BR33]